MLISITLLAALLQGGAQRTTPRTEAPPAVAYTPNVVVIVADDFGVDLMPAYGESTSAPCMPNLDALAGQSRRFRNAWASPVCSPTRALLLTGRYGFRTGIGNIVNPTTSGLPFTETTLPELLTGYDSTYVGKWHLSGNLGASHPNTSGFARFAGTLTGAVTSYTSWTKVVNGSSAPSTLYATTDTTNEAVSAVQTMQAPWVLFVAYNAPHSPHHVPPSSLCAGAACPTSTCAGLPASPSEAVLARAAAQALDTELGRFLTALDSVDPSAYVFFLGDNGTAPEVSIAPFTAAHAKGSVFEGGINVPLLVRGPGIAPGESAALVSCVDVFATIAELAHVTSTATDSISFVPCLQNPSATVRTAVYAEIFATNGSPPFTQHRRAVRDARYKLIRNPASDQLYDLALDPFETMNLMPISSPTEQAAFDALLAELVALGVD